MDEQAREATTRLKNKIDNFGSKFVAVRCVNPKPKSPKPEIPDCKPQSEAQTLPYSLLNLLNA